MLFEVKTGFTAVVMWTHSTGRKESCRSSPLLRHTHIHVHTHTLPSADLSGHIWQSSHPPLPLLLPNSCGKCRGELQESRVRGVALAHSPPCSLFLSSIEKELAGPSPDARLCCGAPPCCVHRDLVDAESCRERRQGHLLSLRSGKYRINCSTDCQAVAQPRRQAASPVSQCAFRCVDGTLLHRREEKPSILIF